MARRVSARGCRGIRGRAREAVDSVRTRFYVLSRPGAAGCRPRDCVRGGGARACIMPPPVSQTPTRFALLSQSLPQFYAKRLLFYICNQFLIKNIKNIFIKTSKSQIEQLFRKKNHFSAKKINI